MERGSLAKTTTNRTQRLPESATLNNYMKVLVRDDEKRLYWGNHNEWVQDADAAQPFPSLQDAGKRARAELKKTTSVVLSYENPPCELALNPDFCV